MGIEHLDEFGVDPLRKEGVVLIAGADPLEIKPGHAGGEKDAVGVSHRDTGEGAGCSCQQSGRIDCPFSRQFHRNQRRLEDRRSHIDLHRRNNAVLNGQAQRFDSAERLKGDHILTDSPTLIEVFADASGRIAAHLSLAAVGVEHPHPRVRRL